MPVNVTERQKNELIEIWSKFDTSSDDYKEVLEYLDSSDFRSFGDKLLSFIQRKNSDVTQKTVIEYLKKCCETNNMDIIDIASDSTLDNWFNNKTAPSKGNNDRDVIFAIAFALNLTPEETAELFHKVYMDRAFNYRNEKDAIYYYCLSNQKSWRDANNLIEQVGEIIASSADHTVYTNLIKNDISSIREDEALIDYIKSHGNNFAKKNVSAHNIVKELFIEANDIAKKEADVNKSYYIDNPYYGQDEDSAKFTYEMIIGRSVTGEKGTVRIFNDSKFPKEIKKRFPEAGTLTKKNHTYEEIRKLIILLYAYIFWYKAKKSGQTDFASDFIEETNGYLDEAGLPELYYRNPYDWMFMWCALTAEENKVHPIDVFRDLVYEALDDGSEENPTEVTDDSKRPL